MKLPEVLKSKKAQAFYVGVLTVLLRDVLELDPEQIKMIVELVMAYVLGQGLADINKSAAQIKAGSEAAKEE